MSVANFESGAVKRSSIGTAVHGSGSARGWVVYTVKRLDGSEEMYVARNVVTDAGRDLGIQRIAGLTANPVQYIAIGDGDAVNPGNCAAASTTDTALGNELTRAQATVTKTANVGEVRLDATFTVPAGATWSVCESGTFDAASGGTLYSRDTMLVKNLASGESITITWFLRLQ